MRISISLLLWLVAMLVYPSSSDFVLNPSKCDYCYAEPHCPVCAVGRGTYWNMCELQCNNLKLKHVGQCTYDDLLENITNE
ncbi:hypothetical protein evm_004295 [Chilo suppressalis]|nr:hypothetical protein evm_004295 [Chilo suppressalis]